MPPGLPLGITECAGRAIAAGADWVQLREKDLAARPLLALARQTIRAVTAYGKPARVIVNDRLDVALTAGAAGVHLGAGSLPAGDVVAWCRRGNAPPGFLVGVSCHSREEALRAAASAADYIFFGPVFDTPSKRLFGEPQGIERLAEVCGAVSLPVFAIGGIGMENAADCLHSGAAGIAAIRMFQEERHPAALAGFLTRLHDFRG